MTRNIPRRLDSLLLVIGATSLAAITLVPPATSRMYTSPWELFYWTALLVPALRLLWLAATEPRFRLPSRAWTTLAAATAIVILLSALFSPYRGSALLWSAVPLGAIALFFGLADWLAGDANRGHRLDAALTVAFGIAMLVCMAWWLADVVSIIERNRFREAFFAMRNPHPLGHSNYTAGLALLSLPWLVHAARGTTKLRAVGMLGVVLALGALFTSGSRGGLLGLGVFAVSAIFLEGISRRRVAILILAIAGIAIIAVANPRVRRLLAPRDPGAAPNPSTVQRIAMLKAGIELGKQRPILGWGLHTTPLVYPRVRHQLAGGAENVLQLHSLPVELWAGLGSGGILALLGIAALIFRQARRHPTATAALLGYGAFALTDYQLDVPIIAFAIAAIGARAAAAADEEPRIASAARWVLVGIIVAVITAVILLGRRDVTPQLNATALALAQKADGRDQATAMLRESLQKNPRQEIAHFNLGWLLLVSDPAAAEQHFVEAAQLVPDKGGVYFGIGLSRLNRHDTAGAAGLLALECLNDPRFLASYWWQEPSIGALRGEARLAFAMMLEQMRTEFPVESWHAAQLRHLATVSGRLGEAGPGAERAYRRQRTGYPVLMRDQDISPPVDVYDVRETSDFEESLAAPLPPKGWLPSPLLLKLLDAARAPRQ